MNKIYLFALLAFVLLLARTDRYFFKHNDSFSIRFIYSSIANEPLWDISSHNETELDSILSQKFTYFAKGTHCYAFESEDGKYVLKFHRYPSHMRLFPWLNHPFSYRFSPKRIRIKEHNLSRFAYFMRNYKQSFEELQEETGVLLLHINRTHHLKRAVQLIDRTQNEYAVPLDQVTFLLQRKAELIFPTLEKCMAEGNGEEVKVHIAHVAQLIADSYRKGYVDNDPVLKRNYGLLADRAIYIDTGELVKRENHAEPLPVYLEKVTHPLREWILGRCPDLLPAYEEILTKSLNK